MLLSERFWSRVSRGDGCWEWTGARGAAGYGHMSIKKRAVGAHRISYELTNGPIPAGMFVCHRCDNRLCVRPDHLFLGTQRDNVRDAWAKGRLPKPPRARLKTHCVRGHAFTDTNVHVNPRRRGRICRACMVAKLDAYEATKRARRERRQTV